MAAPGRLPDLGIGRFLGSVAGLFAVGEAQAAAQPTGARQQGPPATPPPVRVREVAEQRSATSKVFELSDGRFEAELSAEPVHFRDAQGRWQDIDATVRELPVQGYRFGVDRNGFTARFGESTDRLARFELGDRHIALGVDVAARRLAPRVDGDSVTYAGAFEGADLVYEVTGEQLKESIVLAAPPAEATYRFTMQLAGVTARAHGDGSIGFYPLGPAGDGPPVFVMPKPFMFDGAPDAKSPNGKVWSDEVTQSVEQRGSQFTITVRADHDWLTAPERRYPVVIDPTIKLEPTPTTGQDTQIWSDTPTRNDGSHEHLSVGTDNTGVARSLIKFDTSVVPAGTSLSSARLRVYYDNELWTGVNNVTMETRRITQAWAENTAIWNTMHANFAEAGLSTQVKLANTANVWHEFDVRNIAQSWVSGSAANHGLMLKSTNEALSRGGAIYQAAEFAYGEIENRPKLILTYGRPSVDLRYPTKLYATGAELTWPAYVDPNPGDPNDDLVELQVHRTVYQAFTPSASTLIAPLPPTATSFTDTTAVPTPAESPEPFGNAYYYMIAAKTRDGQLIPGPTQVARLPKAGLITQIFHGGVSDATLSLNQPNTNLDTIGGQPWIMVGNNSGTYGRSRAVVRFDDLSALPAAARIVDADFMLWAFYSNGSGATFDAHPIVNRSLVENQVTWNRASTAEAWATPGGDIGPALDNVVGITNDPRWRIWENKDVVQGWVDNSTTNRGYLVKLRDEAGPAQRVLFLSGEAAEPQLRPNLVVTYTQPTAEQTYYAPATPTNRMQSDFTYQAPVSITNTTTTTWLAADQVLSYRWTLPDGTDVTGGNRLETTLPHNVAPGQTVTVQADVRTTLQGAEGNKREQQIVNWDLRNRTAGTWLSATGGPPALPQRVAVESPTSDPLGLEKFYAYAGAATGAGSNVLVNQHAGNAVFSYDAVSNPGRGLNTFLRLTYNSLDTTTTAGGYGWSIAAAGLVRLGARLELHPRGQDYPERVTLPDGDGTSHRFTRNPDGVTYAHPKGVHLYLQRLPGTDPLRRWSMTAPDRTEFLFDEQGWLSAIRDRNGNEQTFTYTQRHSNNEPRKFLAYVTDPHGRHTLELDYWERGETSNPKIIDQVQSIRDVSGRTLTFAYSTQGLLVDLVDGAGSAQPKAFHFDYDMTQGNKNVKLVKIRDPRLGETDLAYYTAPVDPRDKWKLRTITDRLDHVTTVSYDEDPAEGDRESTVLDAEQHSTTFVMDTFGLPTKSVNAKTETTELVWDDDHNVTSLTEANDAVSTWTYDPKTGYPLTIRDAEAVFANGPATVLGYQTSLNGHIAELTSKTSPEGRRWEFGYDSRGNLTTVTDPKGVATPSVPDDFQSSYGYDEFGRLTSATDANGNPTTFGDFHESGYPRTITDALTRSTDTEYDARGNVTAIVDALDKRSEFDYDTFGRPGQSRVPLDQAADEFIITPAPVYDANDNITQVTAPNSAVSTAIYDAGDQLSSMTAPPDTTGGPARTTSVTYDRVGNVLTETQPKGNLTPADPNDYLTRYGYDEIYQLTTVTDVANHVLTYHYDNVGNLTKVVDPRKHATPDPDDYTVRYTYDRNHRQRTVVDALGHDTVTGYDRDGLVVTTEDQENNVTTNVYDERGSLVEVRVPHQPGVVRTTKFAYDEAGNRTKVTTPRGVETTDDPDDFVIETVYDQLDRVREQLTAFDRDDPAITTADRTIYNYDEVGNLATVDAPASAGQTVRNVTRHSYFDNGWVRSSTDPWDIVTSFTYNELGQQTSRTLTSAGGSADRTMSWTYFPDGKLQSRSDDGVPVGRHVALVDNSDAANTVAVGTWATSSAGTGFTGYDYRTGTTGTFAWRPYVPADGTYEVLVKYPAVAGAATGARFTVDTGTGQTPVTVNQSQNAGQWVSLGSFPLTTGNAASVTLSNPGGGTIVADAVKFVRNNSGDTDTERKTFGYDYDPNGNLVSLTDSSPGAAIDNYRLVYDGLNRLDLAEERAGSTVRTSTDYAYNENGLPTSVAHTAQTSTYRYDPRDLVDQVTVTEPGAAAKVTEFGYWPRGLQQFERKANQNRVDYTYTLDGLLATQVERKTDLTLIAQHTIDYSPNGHRTRDASKLQNADNPSAYLDEIHEYGYDPRDRIRSVTKKAAPSGAVLETESYSHDANNNVVAQTVENVSTAFSYDRNRLVSSSSAGSTAGYNYDPFGRLDSVTSAGQVIESYLYDGFDRTLSHRKRDTGGALVTTSYVYDPLDRTSAKTDKAGTPTAKTTTFAYLGLTEQVATESVAGQVQRSYQYDPIGRRLSQFTRDPDGGGPGQAEDSFYGYNPHTDVEQLTKTDGTAKATYGYTAYGTDDTQAFTGIDKPDPTNPNKEPFNYYRYNSKRFDPATRSYDMGFRDYNPGLNRFLTRDLYNGALADLNLGANPWTGNRYAFTSGNPITGIEIDGHFCDGCGLDTAAGSTVGCSYSTTGVCGGSYTEAEAHKQYQIQTGQNTDPALQPDFAGARIPTFDELKQLRPLGHGYGEGDTYADAVRDWAYNRCVDGRDLGSDFCNAAADQGWLDPTNPALGQAILLSVLPGGIPARLLGKGATALLGKALSRPSAGGQGARATLAEVNALVPEGQTLGSWGQQIWGHGADGAKSLIGARSADELAQIPGLNVQSATVLRNFYQGAVEAGKGGATAPIRVQLLDDIIKRMGG